MNIRELVLEAFLNEASLEDIYLKYYKHIPANDFQKIVKADPTSVMPNKAGRYSKWLLLLYSKKQLKIEDLYKATEYLEIFDRYKAHESIPIKDIGKIKTLPELYLNIQQVAEALENGEAIFNAEEERQIKGQETEKVYEDNVWLIITPKTERAACYYGKGTKWCTAAREKNMFDHYNDDGPLYININKKTGKKFQFHFESGQFMNEIDQEIDLFKLTKVPENMPMLQFYSEKIIKWKNNKIQFSQHIFLRTNGDKRELIAPNGWEDFSEFFNDNRNEEFISDLLTGEGYKYFDSYQVDIKDIWNDIDENNMTIIKRMLDSEEVDVNDIEEHADLENAITLAAADALSSAAESEAYNAVIDPIKDKFGIIDKNWETYTKTVFDKNTNKRTEMEAHALVLNINPAIWTTLLFMSFIQDSDTLKDQLELEFEEPHYGFGGDMDISYFNERLGERLAEI